MEIQKTSGIVLSSKIFSDSDILCQILTRDYGKRKFIFKGLKKSRKRPKSAADPGTLLNFVYYFHDNRDIYVINDFAIENNFTEIRGCLNKIYLTYYLLEIVEKTTGFNDVNVTLFNLLSAGIISLMDTASELQLAVFFTIHMLRIHGILPGLTDCKICNSRSYINFSLDVADLSLVCGGCRKQPNSLDIIAKEFIYISMKCKFSEIDHSRFNKASLKNLLFHLTRFIENYFNIDIKTSKYILTDQI